jgi:hypothetical protein
MKVVGQQGNLGWRREWEALGGSRDFTVFSPG